MRQPLGGTIIPCSSCSAVSSADGNGSGFFSGLGASLGLVFPITGGAAEPFSIASSPRSNAMRATSTRSTLTPNSRAAALSATLGSNSSKRLSRTESRLSFSCFGLPAVMLTPLSLW